MTRERDERLFDGLVRRAFVPTGFRPETAAGEEAMLEALGHIPISEDRCDRILQKASGELSFDCELATEATPGHVEQRAESAELAAMFRGEGEDLSADLADRLRKLEEETEEEADLDGDEDDDG